MSEKITPIPNENDIIAGWDDMEDEDCKMLMCSNCGFIVGHNTNLGKCPRCKAIMIEWL